MTTSKVSGLLTAIVLSLSALVVWPLLLNAQTRPDQGDIIRVSAELVQTSVVVLDKQRRFVDRLKPENFQLTVDGKPVTISQFEAVVAGTATEEKLGVIARKSPSATPGAPAALSNRGRTIVFFIDDLHLSAASVEQTRKAILDFVEKQMGIEDQVAIFCSSGQIGFLQSFTDVKPVLRAAVARVHHKPYAVFDAENIPMTEYQAVKIDQGDRDATNYFVTELLKQTNFSIPGGGGLGPPSGGPVNRPQPPPRQNGMTRETAERNVRNRAQLLLRQSSAISINTMTTLEGLVRGTSQMGGRKLVFFISDGFFLNDRNTGFGERLKQITDAAVRADTVLYTIDARGIVSLSDASSNRADFDGRLSRANLGELSASQDPLTALAADTGGRAFLNTGALSAAITDTLKETSNYYVLAWRPETDEGGKFHRIEVTVTGGPELSVRVARGFFSGSPAAATRIVERKSDASVTTPEVNAAKGAAAEIMAALKAPEAKKGLPTQLAVSFIDVPNTGLVLTAATQMATDVLGYGSDGKQTAAIDLAGVVLNDQGKQVGGFKNRLNIKPSLQGDSQRHPAVIYTHKVPLQPGLYQVRVAALDQQSGRVGSAAQWIEVPDLASKRLTISSLMIGGQFIGSTSKQVSEKGQEQLQFSVDRRFARGSHLNFLTFVYNASRAGNTPNLEAQIRIFRSGQAIVTSPIQKVALEANADLARIIYGADIALQNLAVGRYVLQVTIFDRLTQASAVKQVSFEIE